VAKRVTDEEQRALDRREVRPMDRTGLTIKTVQTVGGALVVLGGAFVVALWLAALPQFIPPVVAYLVTVAFGGWVVDRLGVAALRAGVQRFAARRVLTHGGDDLVEGRIVAARHSHLPAMITQYLDISSEVVTQAQPFIVSVSEGLLLVDTPHLEIFDLDARSLHRVGRGDVVTLRLPRSVPGLAPDWYELDGSTYRHQTSFFHAVADPHRPVQVVLTRAKAPLPLLTARVEGS
jgi:hypothetical protein